MIDRDDVLLEKTRVYQLSAGGPCGSSQKLIVVTKHSFEMMISALRYNTIRYDTI
jgi:hypothetical protein